MDDSDLLRYSRHILLPEFGIEGQQQLLRARVLIIGAGGLGSPAAMYLAASGVGTITICDDDSVDLTNLQRQIVHRASSIGQRKVDSARDTLHSLNPDINISALCERPAGARLEALLKQSDVVLDCSDNFATRYELNRYCHQLRIPLVSGAAIRFEGQVTVFDFRRSDSPCYNCLYPEAQEAEETRCALMGVFSPLVGLVGSMQAAETLKLLANTGTSLCGRLVLIDALSMQIRTVQLAKDACCPVCSASL